MCTNLFVDKAASITANDFKHAEVQTDPGEGLIVPEHKAYYPVDQLNLEIRALCLLMLPSLTVMSQKAFREIIRIDLGRERSGVRVYR